MTEGAEKSLYPEVRAALTIIFQLGENPPVCPKYLVDVGQMVFPELQNQVAISSDRSYVKLKPRLMKVPSLIALYWSREERETAKWAPEDLAILRMLKQKWQHHQVGTHLNEFMRRKPPRDHLRKKLVQPQ